MTLRFNKLMNPLLQTLQPYPFEKLNALKAGLAVSCQQPHIALSIGEPKHQPPQLAINAWQNNLDKVSLYPKTAGRADLKQAIIDWLNKRFGLSTSLTPQQVLPLNGTREGIFSFVQAIADGSNPNGKILMPNPFYQIYEGAALLAGVEPYFIPCLKDNGFLADIESLTESDEQALKDCQILFICTPGNPSGAIIPEQQLIRLIQLAEQYDFIIASDECYSEIYFDESQPPCGLLQAAASMGRHDYKRCVVFHSLSKRSNLPGLRSGFIAGDQDVIQAFLQYRTYHGCAMAEPTQLASIAAWQDEAHVVANRSLYQEKFKQVLDTLDGSLNVNMPDAAFYLWPELPIDDETFCQRLFAEQHITCLPGQYLSRTVNGLNPGKGFARIALVAEPAECIAAAQRIKQFMQQHFV